MFYENEWMERGGADDKGKKGKEKELRESKNERKKEGDVCQQTHFVDSDNDGEGEEQSKADSGGWVGGWVG